MKLSEIQGEFARDVAKLIEWVDVQGWYVTLGSAWRPLSEQRRLVASGASKTMHSQHLNRLAIDLNLFIDGDYQLDTDEYWLMGEYWKSLHPDNRWGGDWGWDGNHFERLTHIDQAKPTSVITAPTSTST